jgi:hypothetical protein
MAFVVSLPLTLYVSFCYCDVLSAADEERYALMELGWLNI